MNPVLEPPRSEKPEVAASFEIPADRAETPWQPPVWERWWTGLRVANSGPSPKTYTLSESFGRQVAYWSQARSIYFLLVFCLLVLGFLWQASYYWVSVIDDSYITFRFSENLLEGHGLVFNPGGPRVEGYTNFLWMVLCAGALGLGWDVMYFAKVLGLACTIGTMAVSWSFAKELRGRDDSFNLLPAAFLAFNAHTAHWSLMGMETPGAVFLVFWTYQRFLAEVSDPKRRLLSPLIAAAAAMTRIDSLYFMTPIGVYGLAMVLRGDLRLKRMVMWAAIAATVFGSYFAWKVWYFQDLAPNTYYAKQRLVSDPNRTRGWAHLYEWYLNQNGGEERPQIPASLPEGSPQRKAAEWDQLQWRIAGGPVNALWWVNWWVASALALLAVPRLRNLLLIAAPIAMNVYYLVHVDGDWMPNFRFLQVVTPFWAVAGAVAIGLCQDAADGLSGWARAALRWPVFAFFSLALLGLSVEQLRIGYVYVFHREPNWYPRGNAWRPIDEVRENYSNGFSAPLGPVSDWMLLNTQAGASIFMSDIGQPLWFSQHLNLYDVDGLTDKFLAHAPSVRGDLKSPERHLADVLRERNQADPTPRQLDEAKAEARKRDFNAHLDRNAKYILEQEKPEYLLIFIQHEDGNPAKRGWPYPEISARVYNNPIRERDYELLWQEVKIGGVYNNVFRRKDVPIGITDSEKVARLKRVIELNPRLHYLVPLLLREVVKMQEGIGKDAGRKLFAESLPRVAHNTQIMGEISNIAAGSGDDALAEAVMRQVLERDGDNPDVKRAFSQTLWRLNRREQAVEMLESVLPTLPPTDNSAHYILAFYYESLERPEDAARISRDAAARVPGDMRAWMDLGSIAYRAAYRPGVTDAKSLEHRRTALEGYEGINRLKNGTDAEVLKVIERLKQEIGALEARLAAGS